MSVYPSRVTVDHRLAQFRNRASAAEIDTISVSSGDDMAYLTGEQLLSHERLTALILPTDPRHEPVLVLPAVEDTPKARAAARRVGAKVTVWHDGEDPLSALTEVLGDVVAVSGDLPARHLIPLQERIGKPVRSASPVIDAVRAVKSTEELAALSDAAQRIDAVHARMDDLIRVGESEQSAAKRIAAAILDEGLEKAEFIIVGSGPNGANPHHGVSDRIIEVGDIVVVDIGGPVPSGYHSDCTRTYSMGAPSQAVHDAYAQLELAQARARSVVRPGISIGEVDAAARSSLSAAGLGEFFTHRTGHGIGIGLHEPPFVAPHASELLEEGMVFSIEPGIYFPGQWGARLEDIVAVTADGCKELNRGFRGLRVL